MRHARLGQHVARVQREQPPAHVNGLADDLLRRLLGHLLDVHAARRADDGDGRLAGAVERDAEVVFFSDLDLGCDEDFLHRQPFDVHPQHLLRRFSRQLWCVAELDAACLAASADVDLRLDDDRFAELARDGLGLLWGRSDLPRLDRNAVAPQDVFGLILVNLHCRNPCAFC